MTRLRQCWRTIFPYITVVMEHQCCMLTDLLHGRTGHRSVSCARRTVNHCELDRDTNKQILGTALPRRDLRRSVHGMKEIGRAMILPTAVAAAMGSLYLWRQLHVWPPGKEGWLEEGIVMMVFHLFLLVILLPVIVWSVARVWTTVKIPGRLALVVTSCGLVAATVVLPEMALRRMERIRPNQASDATSEPAPSAASSSFQR